jgi:hypothetical protein
VRTQDCETASGANDFDMPFLREWLEEAVVPPRDGLGAAPAGGVDVGPNVKMQVNPLRQGEPRRQSSSFRGTKPNVRSQDVFESH